MLDLVGSCCGAWWHRRARPACSSSSAPTSNCASSGWGWSINMSMPIALAPIRSMLASARASMVRSSGERLLRRLQSILRIGDQDDAAVLGDLALIFAGHLAEVEQRAFGVAIEMATARSLPKTGSISPALPSCSGRTGSPRRGSGGDDQAGSGTLRSSRTTPSTVGCRRPSSGSGPASSDGAAGPRSAALPVAARPSRRPPSAARHANSMPRRRG